MLTNGIISGAPREEYLPRYRRFMAAPGYARGVDWIASAPNGRAASFCIAWPDESSHCGLVEPMGTHPDFQRMGLGRAVMLAGLQYLQSSGMRSARMCVRADNHPAIRLYESVGFQVEKRLRTFQKMV